MMRVTEDLQSVAENKGSCLEMAILTNLNRCFPKCGDELCYIKFYSLCRKLYLAYMNLVPKACPVHGTVTHLRICF